MRASFHKLSDYAPSLTRGSLSDGRFVVGEPSKCSVLREILAKWRRRSRVRPRREGERPASESVRLVDHVSRSTGDVDVIVLSAHSYKLLEVRG
jgi:hypothetical protein